MKRHHDNLTFCFNSSTETMFTVEMLMYVCANLALTSSYDSSVITTVAVQLLWFFLVFRVPSKTLRTLADGPDDFIWSRQPMRHIRGTLL